MKGIHTNEKGFTLLVKARQPLFTASFSLPTALGYDRYKLVVQVVIGELRGQGVK